MKTRRPRVFTIAVDQPFLEVLARAVLNGFPREGFATSSPMDLARATILVPNRRAARDLECIFFEVNEGKSILLPRIRPIGDIDEDLFENTPSSISLIETTLPEAISPIGRDLILIDMIGEWARDNPQERLALEIAASPIQSVALAASLAGFLDSLETEDIDPARIADLYGIEAARHREAILGFLALIREKLPHRLHDKHLLAPKVRRSLLLRREAQRLLENPTPWPVIAAGSTGSIPATRELLGAIAQLPQGAVVLPGLDTSMDDESWAAVSAQHPQFVLKQLLGGFTLSRNDVTTIPGPESNFRGWLASDIMRPSGTSEKWSAIARDHKAAIDQAFAGLELVEARHVREEAITIALILRRVLETPGKTASLVTPDRSLARRVKQHLEKFNVDIDDSAGEPLSRFGGAALLGLLIDLILGGLTPDCLLAFLKHDLCQFGLDGDSARNAVHVIELTVFRAGAVAPDVGTLADLVMAAKSTAETGTHVHPVISRISAADWLSAVDYGRKIAACLLPLADAGEKSLSAHIESLVHACELAAGDRLWLGEEGELLKTLLVNLTTEGEALAPCTLAGAAVIVRHYMSVTPLRRASAPPTRLAILGLLEARLARPDVMILGGLNEGRWPASPDPGPWLNRPMRDLLGMQQPESQIGQTAHDFVQALGCTQVYITWSRRVGDAPAIPSRWILRLQVLAEAAGLTEYLEPTKQWQALVAQLDEPGAVKPCGRPRPRPPTSARPRQLSVTRVETLIRDPYAIYADKVLGLKPLDDISAEPDLSMRGTIFHAAIGDFLNRFPNTLPPDALDYLLRRGRHHFSTLLAHPDVAAFWWPQFVRIAGWLVAEETSQRADICFVHSEITGRHELIVAGQPFTLTCRADRIDLLSNGLARIFDYKTGNVPSALQVAAGLAPQLTLQAAMLEYGAFKALGKRQACDIAYVKLGGGDLPGTIITPDLKMPLLKCARKNLAGLIKLLTAYAKLHQAYLPRALAEKEDEEYPFDHLSRYREWALSGDGKNDRKSSRQ